MAKKQLYKVSMAKGFPAESRHTRAGVTLQSNDTLEVELTPDQVKEIKDDRYMVISKASGQSSDQGSDEGEGGSSSQSGADEGQADDSAEDQGAEDSSVEDSEESGSEDQGDEGSDADAGQDTTDASGEGDSPEGEEATDSEDAEPSVDDLVRDNSREELDKLATEAGVENADQLDNKQAVAEAIVAKRG